MPTTDTILAFLAEIGIVCHLETINEKTFLPGLLLRNGDLVIDKEKLLYPGDILHEAGHLACMPPDIRKNMSGDLENNDLNQAGEIMAQAWSYAVCIHLNIDPKLVFHDHGYKNKGQGLIQIFESGSTPGLPLLQWLNMCYDNDNAAAAGALPFPNMISWTCKENKFEENIHA